MYTEGIFSIGDGLLDIDEECFKRLLVLDEINEIYEVEQTPFARGKFAAVRRAIHKNSGSHFAAKFLKRRRRAQSSDKEIKHEIAVLMLCAGEENIVNLNAVHETRSDTALLLELATGGELQTILDNEECLSEAQARHCMREVLKALKFLHERSIAHLDLKPQNILLTGERIEDGLKLCDFGISRVVAEGINVREMAGTPDYVAPEVLQYEPLSLLTDIWSVGVLAYVLLSGFSPFGGDTKQETFLNISQCALTFPDNLFGGVSQAAIDFIRCALRIKPNDRMTAAGCLEHIWLKDECTLDRQIFNKSAADYVNEVGDDDDHDDHDVDVDVDVVVDVDVDVGEVEEELEEAEQQAHELDNNDEQEIEVIDEHDDHHDGDGDDDDEEDEDENFAEHVEVIAEVTANGEIIKQQQNGGNGKFESAKTTTTNTAHNSRKVTDKANYCNGTTTTTTTETTTAIHTLPGTRAANANIVKMQQCQKPLATIVGRRLSDSNKENTYTTVTTIKPWNNMKSNATITTTTTTKLATSLPTPTTTVIAEATTPAAAAAVAATTTSTSTATIIIAPADINATATGAKPMNIVATVTLPNGNEKCANVNCCTSSNAATKATAVTAAAAAAATTASSSAHCLFPDAPTTPKVIRKAPLADRPPTSVKALVKKFQLESTNNTDNNQQQQQQQAQQNFNMQQQQQHQYHHHHAEQQQHQQHHVRRSSPMKFSSDKLNNEMQCNGSKQHNHNHSHSHSHSYDSYDGCQQSSSITLINGMRKSYSHSNSNSNGSCSNGHLKNGTRRASEPLTAVHKKTTAQTPTATTCAFGLNNGSGNNSNCSSNSSNSSSSSTNGIAVHTTTSAAVANGSTVAQTTQSTALLLNGHQRMPTHHLHRHHHAHLHNHHQSAAAATNNMSLDQGIIC